MGVEKDFPIAILFRAFNDRPTKHRGIHSDLFESLEKSCFFSTNLQFPLFFRIFAIARGAWWRSSFFSSSL